MISGLARFAVAAAVLLLASGPGHARLSLNVQLGFGGLFRLGAAFPLYVEVINTGPPARGVLEVSEMRGGPTRGIGSYVLSHRRDLFLAAQSRKVVRLTVDPDTVSKPLRVVFRTSDDRVEESMSLRGHFTSQPLILLLTRHNVSPVLPVSQEHPVPIVSLEVAELPNDARAYAGVWSVALYEQSLRGLTEPQRRALEGWLRSGGMLLVLGGLHYALYQEPVTASFLPVGVRGLKRVNGLPVLKNSYGGEGLDESFFVQDALVTRGNVLAEEQNTPIWVEQRRGQGKIAYLALDVGRPPVSEWSGLGRLFERVLGPVPGRPAQAWSAWDRSVFTGIIEEFGLIRLGSSVAVFFIGMVLYLGGLAVWYRSWRRRDLRLPVLTVWLVGLVASSTLIGYWYFDRSYLMPDGVLVSSTVIDGDPWSEEAAVQSNVGLFSTRKRDFAFRVASGWTHLDYVAPAGVDAVEPHVFVRDELRSTGVWIPLMEWDSGLFKVRGRQPFPVRVEWRRLADRYALQLSNLAETRMTECWLIIGERAFELGDVPPGGRITREVAISEPQNGGGLRFPDISFGDKARGVLLRKSIFSPEDRELGAQKAYVIGWVEGAPPEVQMDNQRVRKHQYTLFRVSIPIGSEEDL